MSAFQVVRCPKCQTIVLEITTGLARGECRNRRCRARVWVLSDGHEAQVIRVDKRRSTVANSGSHSHAESQD